MNHDDFLKALSDGEYRIIGELKEHQPEKFLALLSQDNYRAFRESVVENRADSIDVLFSYAEDKIKDMLSANDFEAYRVAMSNHDFDMLDHFIELGPAPLPNSGNLRTYAAFREALNQKNLQALDELIAEDPVLIRDFVIANDYRAFIKAIKTGELSILNKLIALVPDKVGEILYLNKYAVLQTLALANRWDFVEKLMIFAPNLIEDMIKANIKAVFEMAAGLGRLDLIEKIIATAPDKVQGMAGSGMFWAFFHAIRNGHINIIDRLISLVPNEAIEVLLSKNGFLIFRDAVNAKRLDSTDRLLHFPLVFDYAETHTDDYGDVVQSFTNRHLTTLSQEINAFRAKNPGEVFDISNPEQARLYFYMMRHCIREGSVASIQHLELLISIPAVRALAPQESNELIRLALSRQHREAASVLIGIPEVLALAQQDHFYQHGQQGLDLRVIAQNRESSMRALTPGEEKALERVRQEYQAEIDERGVAAIMSDLRQMLVARYRANPATVHTGDGRVLELPFDDEAFEILAQGLSADTRERALESYYQHPDHTAYRYLMNKNPWVSPDADFVHRFGNDARSYYEDFESLISLMYLAAIDESAEPVNEWTIEGRISHFIKELAFIGRAHNWDDTRINLSTGASEEYDDLKGDKPSCSLGVNTRLFQSVQGHPLLSALTKDIVLQEVRSVMRDHFISRINDENCAALFKAWQAIIEGGTDDLSVLQQLDLSKEEQKLHIKAISEKLSELYEGQFDVTLNTYLISLFTFSNALNNFAEKFGGETDLLRLLIDKQKEMLNPLIFNAIQAHFEKSIQDGDCKELKLAWTAVCEGRDDDTGVLKQLNLSDEVKASQLALIAKAFKTQTGLALGDEHKTYVESILGDTSLAQNHGQRAGLGDILARKSERPQYPRNRQELREYHLRFYGKSTQSPNSNAAEAPKPNN